MRHLTLSLLALVLVAPRLSAAEDAPARTLIPSVVEAPKMAAPAPQKLDKVVIEQRASAKEAGAAQLPARGSFWWLVGVVVVAGVILAVLL